MNARVCSVFSAKIEFQRRMCSICMCDQVWPIKEGIIEIIPFYLCRVIDREIPFVCAFSPSSKNTQCTFPIWFKIGNTKLKINQLFKCIIESFWKKGLTAIVTLINELPEHIVSSRLVEPLNFSSVIYSIYFEITQLTVGK